MVTDGLCQPFTNFNMSQITQIHAHEALAFIDVNGGEIRLAELPQTIANAFGAHTRFNACSAQGMDAHQLTQFFIERSKIVEKDGCVYLNHANVCSH